MTRLPIMFAVLLLLTGCIAFNTSESPSVPDYAAFCRDMQSMCREACGDAGVAAFSCKAAPREGLDYACQCKKPAARL